MPGFLAFIQGPWGTLIGKVLMAMTLAGMIFVAVSRYNDSIRDTERMKNQNAQLAQVIKDNQDFRTRLDILDQKSDKILADTQKKNDKVNETHTTVNRYIASPQAQKSNRESSEVLKNTIGMLRDED